MQSALGVWPFKRGAQAAFDTLMTRLRAAVTAAGTQAGEMQQMLAASFRQLNTDYGFTFALAPMPSLQATLDELQAIERSYSRYLGLGQVWRLAQPGFVEQFRRMLLAKLRVVFESAASDFELWSKAATQQVEAQLQERRSSFMRRREALLRVQAASGELEQRITEVQAQDADIDRAQGQLAAQAGGLLALARRLAAHGVHPSEEQAERQDAA
jgi:hypothetical protein